MSKPILVGYDPRTADRAPVDFAVAAARFTGAPLIVASVQSGAEGVAAFAQHLHDAEGQVDEDLLDDCSEAVKEVEAELREEGIPVACRKFRSTSAARALHEAAEREDAGLLVVGSSRRSAAGRTLLGSTAERLMQGAPCPVAVAPAGWTTSGGPSRIAVAYVNTEEGREALRGAHALAKRAGATLKVFTVVKHTAGMHLETEPSLVGQGQYGKGLETVEGEYRVEAEKELRRVVSALGDDVPIEADAYIGRDPADVIIDISDAVDLLVLGSRGYGPLRAVLLGSVSRRVTAEAYCPVIVLPRGVEAALEALVTEAPGAAAPA
jgi:nucleotide-binding universal stress UspA family protein